MGHFREFEEGCPNCGYWQYSGCDAVGEWVSEFTEEEE